MDDVVVGGAGSAGAALAARPSEDPDRRVLLLEAGRDWRSAGAPWALRSADIIPFMYDAGHQADRQWPKLMARRTRTREPRLSWRGRALGGSSTVNAQTAIRGVPAAFDAWAERGCTGRSANDALPLFDRIEDDPDFGTEVGVRLGGPLPVYRAPMESWGAVDLTLPFGSRGDVREHRRLKGQVGQQPAQTRILAFQILHRFGLVGLKTVVILRYR